MKNIFYVETKRKGNIQMKENRERNDNKMKRKNGFTLIELLAVIVILAIIALIAVPVVMNIINRANKSAFKDSAYGILKAGELFYTDQLLENAGLMEETTFNFPDDIEGLEFKGSKPSKGSMTVRKDGKISMAITNGKHCVTKGFEDEDVTITDDVTNCELEPKVNTLSDLARTETFTKVDGSAYDEPLVTIPSCITNKTKCEAGTPVAIEVAPNTIYKFYVINDDTTKNEVTLIMDRNLGEQVAWYKDNDDTTGNEENNLGPITALNYLNSQTSDWDNIPAISNYEYDGNAGTYGYQKFEIVDGKGKLTSKDGATVTEITGESKARLLTYEEATSAEIGCTTSSRSCPSWIYGNLYDTGDNSAYGYWLLSADPSDSCFGRIISIYYDGFVSYYDVGGDDLDGARPVITLSK